MDYEAEEAAIARMSDEQELFEQWAAAEGIAITRAHDMECADGRFPATYVAPGTETAWRAWVSKNTFKRRVMTANAGEIKKQKMKLRRLLTEYNGHVGHLDCGNALAQYISASGHMLAQEINECAAWLKANDPEFPASWTPL